MGLRSIPVVDLFAGPGGLGEGFSSAKNNAFRICLSAEKDFFAHQTLLLRAYYRQLLREAPDSLPVYLDYCNGITQDPFDKSTQNQWIQASEEARLINLGTIEGNSELDTLLKTKINREDPWVLIGGPPCQAYSMAGRARNRAKVNYRPEADDRHFLYREYLRIIQKYRPAIFVMENVKGILSSKVNGGFIFHSIIRDLANPGRTIGLRKDNCGYRIFSLVKDVQFKPGDSPESINPHDFIIRSEEYGIPQARHRVILLGIREDLPIKNGKLLEKQNEPVPVSAIINNLPPLRSRLSHGPDSDEKWAEVILGNIAYLREKSRDERLKSHLTETMKRVRDHRSTGGLRVSRGNFQGIVALGKLSDWYLKNRPEVWLNHETRGHMEGDLRRYLFAASHAMVHSISPKGVEGFNIEGLSPNHKNWETGHFPDRFRVQLFNRPATTITSHISKDGHYFIHYDPAQCRSLTVREAARIQTFPDNYFFMGNKTQQYHQVGNAVPPYLAFQIGNIVHNLLSQS